MEQWRTGQNDDFPPGDAGGGGGAGGEWGFDALDGSNQDWDNWFAGLEAPDAQRRDFHSAATEPFAPLSDLRRGPPGPPRPPDDEPEPRAYTYAGHLARSTPAAPASRPTLLSPPVATTQPRPSATARPPQPIAPVRQRERPHYRRSPASTLIDSASDNEAEEEESDYGQGISIDDLIHEDDDDDDEEEAMPPATRRSHRSVVDLTNDPSSPPRSTTTRKRAREASTRDATSNKRSHRSSATANPIEELDLTAENPSAEEKLLQTQQAAAIAAQQQQQQPEPDRPLRVGQRTCIICMEPYTNATVTACGHIYCHECLTQALLAGEKNSERGVGNCPVCRKPVNRKKDKQMIPVSFMTREAFRAGRGVRA